MTPSVMYIRYDGIMYFWWFPHRNLVHRELKLSFWLWKIVGAKGRSWIGGRPNLWGNTDEARWMIDLIILFFMRCCINYYGVMNIIDWRDRFINMKLKIYSIHRGWKGFMRWCNGLKNWCIHLIFGIKRGWGICYNRCGGSDK